VEVFDPASTWVNPDQSQSQIYVTTDGQLASLPWCQAPIWDLRPDFYFRQTVVVLFMWSPLSDDRMELSFTMSEPLSDSLQPFNHLTRG
jgi:hypothetical protein